jgi:hypothetical protein
MLSHVTRSVDFNILLAGTFVPHLPSTIFSSPKAPRHLDLDALEPGETDVLLIASSNTPVPC